MQYTKGSLHIFAELYKKKVIIVKFF